MAITPIDDNILPTHWTVAPAEDGSCDLAWEYWVFTGAVAERHLATAHIAAEDMVIEEVETAINTMITAANAL